MTNAIWQKKVYVDFQNADALGRIRLNCNGTIEDLTRHNIQLKPGLVLNLYSDDADADGHPDELRAEGIVSFSEENREWLVTIDWAAIRHASDFEALPIPDNGRSHLSKRIMETSA